MLRVSKVFTLLRMFREFSLMYIKFLVHKISKIFKVYKEIQSVKQLYKYRVDCLLFIVCLLDCVGACRVQDFESMSWVSKIPGVYRLSQFL